MMQRNFDIVILGLSITSSWCNGHAVTYRGLVRELHRRGHRVLFLERDVPGYATHRDLLEPPYGVTQLYADLDQLRQQWRDAIAKADVVIVGSYVPDGVEVGRFVQDTARGVIGFYDIDTPVTLAKLRRGDHEYIAPDLIPRYDLYLSFAGGPILDELENTWGAPRARPLYCSADVAHYTPRTESQRWELGYLGTYSGDRQPRVRRLLDDVARHKPQRRFVVAGPQYPADLVWSPNVERIDHLPPTDHPEFYARQRLTLNVTRDDMIRAGFAPSIRLFEAAACGAPIISDTWRGVEALFAPGEEILLAQDTDDVLEALDRGSDELAEIGRAGRCRVLGSHTAAHRVMELECHIQEVRWAGARAVGTAGIRA